MSYTQTLIDSVRNRYAIYDRPKNGMRNVLIDSFMPSLYINYLKYGTNSLFYPTKKDKFPSSFKAISEFTAELAGVPLVPREELVKMLGYNLKDIKCLLTSVKQKQLTPLFLGYGGTNVNTLYWLKELSRITNVFNIFENMIVVEPDTIAPHNIPRFPMNLNKHEFKDSGMKETSVWRRASHILKREVVDSTTANNLVIRSFYNIQINNKLYNQHLLKTTFNSTNKLKILKQDPSYSQLVNKNVYTSTQYLSMTNNSSCRLHPECEYASYYSRAHETSYDLVEANEGIDFIYGAPDIRTRQELSVSSIPLITATHGDDDASLYMNPPQDTTLQVESYGVIKLGIFFMNQLRMAIGLLEALDRNEHLNTTSRPLLDYSFPQNVYKSKSRYNIQITHSGTIQGD